ncbi:unnamed protein product [Oikopleura dioica]|uniref:Uncharacterized protein n=1 Tax=Oikopleura dioica TaxID=34765 RepID=E4Z156_OIKDI|nr:unnamed protein product [Oikopleura dioica]
MIPRMLSRFSSLDRVFCLFWRPFDVFFFCLFFSQFIFYFGSGKFSFFFWLLLTPIFAFSLLVLEVISFIAFLRLTDLSSVMFYFLHPLSQFSHSPLGDRKRGSRAFVTSDVFREYSVANVCIIHGTWKYAGSLGEK